MEKITSYKALKLFFNTEGYEKLTMTELKELKKEDRDELGQLSAKALGMEWEALKAAE